MPSYELEAILLEIRTVVFEPEDAAGRGGQPRPEPRRRLTAYPAGGTKNRSTSVLPGLPWLSPAVRLPPTR